MNPIIRIEIRVDPDIVDQTIVIERDGSVKIVGDWIKTPEYIEHIIECLATHQRWIK